MKQFIRRSRAVTEGELLKDIKNGAFNITFQHCNNYFNHMLGFIIPYLRKEPIIDE
ncbi:hypothetical protein H311_00677 [Anncaliia algerae PRA109]|nr:hypothetical protein H311_00677 [Anncaliia algerae PRA109]